MMQKAQYGFDAPLVPVLITTAGVITTALGLLGMNVALTLTGVFFLASAVSFIYATKKGKFRIWKNILSKLELKGNEQILDMGCGRGAVLIEIAHRVPQGKAVGIDLWRSQDQSGNSEATTRENARLEDVESHIELHTGDMSWMPFEANIFDVVISSLAIHNITDKQTRVRAIDEAVRVLKPHGTLAITDIKFVKEYAQRLKDMGMVEVTVKSLGVKGWFGGPWMATKLVTAKKS